MLYLQPSVRANVRLLHTHLALTSTNTPHDPTLRAAKVRVKYNRADFIHGLYAIFKKIRLLWGGYTLSQAEVVVIPTDTEQHSLLLDRIHSHNRTLTFMNNSIYLMWKQTNSNMSLKTD